MYLIGWLRFLTWEKWPFLKMFSESQQCTPFSLVTAAICSRGTPSVGCMGTSVVVGCGWLLSVWLVARPCFVWKLMATLWWGQVVKQLTVESRGGGQGPRASAGSLVSRTRFWGGWLQG